MKERPILFSAPMVRALLAGTKTQTRRIAKGLALEWLSEGFTPEFVADYQNRLCPYGHPGDRLWVRETWAYGIHALAAARDEDGPFVYAANGTTQGRLCDRWRPSIHMPRAASRILLEIVSVHVERLQEISEEDAKGEGLYQDQAGRWTTYSATEQHREHLNPVEAYRELWESINGPGSWDVNPWVWVVEFKRVMP